MAYEGERGCLSIYRQRAEMTRALGEKDLLCRQGTAECKSRTVQGCILLCPTCLPTHPPSPDGRPDTKPDPPSRSSDKRWRKEVLPGQASLVPAPTHIPIPILTLGLLSCCLLTLEFSTPSTTNQAWSFVLPHLGSFQPSRLEDRQRQQLYTKAAASIALTTNAPNVMMMIRPFISDNPTIPDPPPARPPVQPSINQSVIHA